MDSENNIVVSVIIPVYNEERYIEKCLGSLIEQTFPREKMEWIVIDGYSVDRTAEILAQYAEQYPITILFNEKRFTPISLNIGIQSSSGRYIVRFDAHAEYPRDYIEKCVDCLETVEADNVGGYVETKADGFIGGAIAKVLSSPFGVGGSAFRTGEKDGFVDTVPYGAFRREVFDRIGLFNASMIRSEDNDINSRIIESGGKVFLSKEIRSVYYCRDSIRSFLKQALQNGNTLFRSIMENPRSMRLRHFVPFIFLLSVLFLPLIGIFFPPAYLLLCLELAAYLLLDIRFSFFCDHPENGIVTLWLFPIFHLTYGMGSLLGLFGVRFI